MSTWSFLFSRIFILSSRFEGYRNQGWISFGDWLGYKEYTWSVSKIKELLRSLKQSGMIYEWKWKEEGGLYTGHFEYTAGNEKGRL